MLLSFSHLFFYPHFSLTTTHYLSSHITQRRKFRKIALPDLPPLTTRIFQKKSPGFYSYRSLYIYPLCSEYFFPFSPGELLLLFQCHLLQEVFPNPDSKLNQQPPANPHSSWALFCLSTDNTGLLLSGSRSEFLSVGSPRVLFVSLASDLGLGITSALVGLCRMKDRISKASIGS